MDLKTKDLFDIIFSKETKQGKTDKNTDHSQYWIQYIDTEQFFDASTFHQSHQHLCYPKLFLWMEQCEFLKKELNTGRCFILAKKCIHGKNILPMTPISETAVVFITLVGA